MRLRALVQVRARDTLPLRAKGCAHRRAQDGLLLGVLRVLAVLCVLRLRGLLRLLRVLCVLGVLRLLRRRQPRLDAGWHEGAHLPRLRLVGPPLRRLQRLRLLKRQLRPRRDRRALQWRRRRLALLRGVREALGGVVPSVSS